MSKTVLVICADCGQRGARRVLPPTASQAEVDADLCPHCGSDAGGEPWTWADECGGDREDD